MKWTPGYTVLMACLLASTVAIAQENILVKTYYDQDSTQLKEEFTLNPKNELTGSYQAYFISGDQKVTGSYRQNLPDGLWTYFYENGRLKTTGYLTEGVENGTWTYYYENGRVRMQGDLVDRKKSGRWTSYYENGSEKNLGSYQDGLKQGIWNYFYEDGKLKAQAYYTDDSGEYKELYPSGALKAAGLNRNGLSTGKWKHYYENGSLRSEGNYRGGKKDGTWKLYHENQALAATGQYLNGEKTGLWKYYYPDGSIRSEGREQNGDREGFWQLYYESGAKKGEGDFTDGSGKFTEFYENGKLKATGAIEKGLYTGRWTFFNENGQEEGQVIFRKGRGIYKGYYEDGVLKIEGPMENDKRVGKWKLYNQDGSLAGFYKPVYEEDRPVFRTSESLAAGKKSDKPGYRIRRSKIRYFKPSINEYRGYIISTSPFTTLMGTLPLGLERYKQERLGYEITLAYRRSFFWRSTASIAPGTNYFRGGTASIRQKLYNKGGNYGLVYLAHQVHYEYLEHTTHAPAVNNLLLKADENNYSYDLLLGTRWLKNPKDGGFTWDVRLGVGIGHRVFKRRYGENVLPANIVPANKENGLFFPIRFGLTLGYLGPKTDNIPIRIKS